MTAILDNTECAFHLLPKDQSLLSLRWMFTIEGSPHYDVINVYRNALSLEMWIKRLYIPSYASSRQSYASSQQYFLSENFYFIGVREQT